ncbi:MAG: ribbon-helix-helix domain-containing protein [Chthoniobacterales bacterium]|nr:ribbon-helix-helix domain-containing protein [Chthoniobacterales bacterium]
MSTLAYTYRTTFSFDQGTVQRLKHLATRWGISQAAVIRRALMHAEESASLLQPDPIETLKLLHQSGHGLSQKAADTYLKEVDKNRKKWRSQRMS